MPLKCETFVFFRIVLKEITGLDHSQLRERKIGSINALTSLEITQLSETKTRTEIVAVLSVEIWVI